MTTKILCLSGGGCRGIYQSVFIQQMSRYENLEKPLWKNFDIIAGTSIGSILAFGIALEKDPTYIRTQLEGNLKKIFEPKFLGILRTGSLYNGNILRNELKKIFDIATLGDCEPTILIPATILDNYGCRVFSNHTQRDKRLSVVDVIMASCAAPSFFLPTKIEGDDPRTYLDGGLWANSPSLCAVTYAKDKMDKELDEIKLLNIGNGESPQGEQKVDIKNNLARGPSMIKTILNTMFATQAKMVEQTVELLIGKENTCYIDSPLQNFIELDDAESSLNLLPPKAHQKAIDSEPEIIRLLTGKMIKSPNYDYINLR